MNVEFEDCHVSFPKNHSLEDRNAAATCKNAADQTFYNLNADYISLRPSIKHFISGKGLVQKAAVQGVSGFLDKRHCTMRNEPWKYTENHPMDLFITDGFTAESVSIDVHYADVPYPINFHIKNLHVPVLRKKHLLEDFLNANKAVGVYNFKSFFELREKRLFVENVPVEHLRTRIDSAADPLEAVADALIDIEACWKDDHVAQHKVFSFLLKIKDIQLSEQGAPYSKSIVSFLNQKRMSLSLQSEFSIGRNEFVGCWSHNDCGIAAAVKSGALRAYQNQVSSKAFQLALAKEYGLWTLQSALPRLNMLFASPHTPHISHSK